MTTIEYYDFLWNYTTFDKTREELILDLELSEEEQQYLDEALEFYKSQEDIRIKQGKNSATYAFYLVEFLEERLDEGVPKEITEEIERHLKNEQ